MAPGYFFGPIPVLGGVRAFSRYQILVVFGLAILVAQAWPQVERSLDARWTMAVRVFLAVGILAPLLYESTLVVGSLRARPVAAIQEVYGPAPAVPALLWTRRPFLHSVKHQTAALEAGYWIGNCVSDLSLPNAIEPHPSETVVPLSTPPPSEIASLGHDRIALAYPPGLQGSPTLALRFLEGFELRGTELIAHDPAPLQGLAVSLLGLVASVGFLFRMSKRRETLE